MGFLITLGLACAGLWFARRQVYIKRRYVVWRSTTFKFEKDAGLAIPMEAWLAEGLRKATEPIVVDIAIEILAPEDIQPGENDLNALDSSRVDGCPLRVLSSSKITAAHLAETEPGGYSDLKLVFEDFRVGISTTRVRPQIPVILTLSVDHPSRFHVETDWNDARILSYRNIPQPTKYPVPVGSERNVWPASAVATSPTPPSSKQPKAGDPISVPRAIFKLLGFVIKFTIVCYVALSIYADASNQTTRVAAIDMANRYDQHRSTVNTAIGIAVGVPLAGIVLFASLLALRDEIRKWHAANAKAREENRASQSASPLQQLEVFFTAPKSIGRLNAGLRGGYATSVRREVIQVRENAIREAHR